ncbi:ribose 5-phosphate isomerase B family protein [Tritrichomonas foetus]|uniref:Ribose 5-phosphate isomerase B family protein n=1 Tax=Tritrichomonas foetus TaxID=1144522 RepID=A0A1J4JCA4_9EUKA|nr:ribose 5-phosphate isomerase B family protein [Tritrichomonas foetus]|eukprot:OHS96768.1 ribose 5-phosphate isomerase B family protein [Tritrichomonas foetus]
MKIAFACDHGGFDYKDKIIAQIKSLGHEVIDFGCNGPESIDYPDFAEPAARAVAEGKADRGVLICGTGIGISIAANKVKGIRCAVVHDHLTTELTRQHNNANMIAFGARIIGIEVALDCVKTFLNTEFQGGRHEARVAKIRAIENKY